MHTSEKFWNKMAKLYARQSITNQEVYQKKLSITRKYLKPNMRILELGCGTGSTALLHAPYVKHIHATDVSSEMLAIAQAQANEKNIRNIDFEKTTAERYSAPDGSIDMVLALSLLHLLENKEDVIAKVYKMLKSSGIFITSTMCLADHMNYIKYIVPLARLFGLMPLLKFFTAKELEKSLTEVGFSIEYSWQQSKKQALFIVCIKKQLQSR